MNLDIGAALEGWGFQPDGLQVRLVAGDDGRDKIQMRVELGVLQMERDGRPDGDRPHGLESLLEHHEARRDHALAVGDDFALDAADCAELMREGMQYYRRYLSAFHLRLYDLVARDTERNLRLLAFVVRHASRNRDRMEFDQYRPYIAMMLARALVMKAIDRDDRRDALARLDEGVARIREFLREYDREDREQDCSELRFLLGWRDEIARDLPPDPLARLEARLKRAVAGEDYEDAARLRDRIRRMKSGDVPAPEAAG